MMADRSPHSAFVCRRLARLAARFARDRRGATAVEFSLIALPFFALLFGILELGMLFVLSTSLDNATNTVARTIRTGASPPPSAAKFKEAVCDELGWLASDCPSNLFVDIDAFKTFGEVVTPTPIGAGKIIKDGDYTVGASEEIMLVRVFYQWKLITPLLTKAVDNVAGGKTLVTSTMTFRNEPYS